MNASLTRSSFFIALLGFLLSTGGCSKAPFETETEASAEVPVEQPAPRPVEKTAAEWFAEGDADGDGRLSSDELPAKLLLEWEVMDLNADGYFDTDEQHAYLNPRGSEVVMEKEKEKPAQTEGEPERERRVGGLDRFFATNDADGDGRISMAEAPGKMQERFAALDVNADGFIDGDEQAALSKRVKNNAWKQRKQGGRGGGKGGFDKRPFGGGGIEQLFPFDIKGGGRGDFGGGGKKK